MLRSLRSRPVSQRTRIIALVLASGLPLLALALFGLWRYLEASRQEVIDDRVAMAEAAALTAQAFVSDVTASAQTLALSPEVTDTGRRAALGSLLDHVRVANPGWDQVTVLDAAGRPLASTGQAPGPPLVGTSAPVASLTARALTTGQPTIGAMEAQTSTGRARLLVDVPLQFNDASRGVLLVSPSLGVLANELRAQARGPQIQVLLVAAPGQALIGPAEPHAWLSSPSVATALGARQSGARQLNDTGGPILVSYAPVSNADWSVLVVQPSGVAFAALDRQASIATLALVVTLAIAGLLAWILGGRLSLYYQRILEARDRAEQARQARDAVLASVSHDLRNPLAAALGYLQLLQRRVAADPEAPARSLAPALAKTELAVTRMRIMTEELVDAARLEAGHELALAPRLTDLVALVRETIEEQALAGRGHRLHVASASLELWVACDAARMGRVIANVISNAIKYSPAESPIVVELGSETDAAGSWATICVADEGVGIPAEDLPHVFERFHRARNVLGQAVGSGLGLAGVRQIVEQHGGRVSLESQEGVGTTVRIHLPRPPAHASPAAPDQVARAG